MPENPEKRPSRLHGGLVFLIALITSAAGCVLAFLAGDYLTDLYHVSNMEGGRALLVVFFCAPLGIIAGFVVGLIVALRTSAAGFLGFLKVQGLSFLIAIALAAVVTGLFWIGADKPPKIDGKNLALDFELRVPSTLSFPADPMNSNIYASLYANNRDNRLAEIDLKSIRKEENAVMVPGTVQLMSHSSERSLLASIGNETGASQFIPIKLPAAPKKENETWSDWIFAIQRADLSTVPEAERIWVRYRVRSVSK